MSRFIADDEDIVLPDADLPLLTAKRLLRHLGVEAAPRDAQVRAVRAWLEANEPQHILRRDLAIVGLAGKVGPEPAGAAAQELARSAPRPGRPTQGMGSPRPASRWPEWASSSLQSAVDRLFPAATPLVISATPALVGVRAADAPPSTEGILTVLDPEGVVAEVQSKWALDPGRFRVWLSRIPATVETVALVAVTGKGNGVASEPVPVGDGRAALSVLWPGEAPPEFVALVLA